MLLPASSVAELLAVAAESARDAFRLGSGVTFDSSPSFQDGAVGGDSLGDVFCVGSLEAGSRRVKPLGVEGENGKNDHTPRLFPI